MIPPRRLVGLFLMMMMVDAGVTFYCSLCGDTLALEDRYLMKIIMITPRPLYFPFFFWFVCSLLLPCQPFHREVSEVCYTVSFSGLGTTLFLERKKKKIEIAT